MLKPLALHFAVITTLALLYALLPAYHSGNLARIMVLAVYAMGYNLLFGYTGLLSLGHALFFAAGMYGLALPMAHWGTSALPALGLGLLSATLVATIVGYLALRTRGVAFMIVSLMFAQAGYLTILLFGRITRGDEGFTLAREARRLAGVDLASEHARYFAAWLLFAGALLLVGWLVRAPFGRTLIAIRENEERARMLGYNTHRHKLGAVILSGMFSGLSGAAYALLFGYAGATFATVQYSIFPLLWVLLGGAGTTIGPLIGVVFMFYLIDYASNLTSAYMLLAGLALVGLALFAPRGIAGALRKVRGMSWLP